MAGDWRLARPLRRCGCRGKHWDSGLYSPKETFGKSVAKAVPLVGGVVSGGITLASYVPMCRKLKNHLATLAPADPAGVENPTDMAAWY